MPKTVRVLIEAEFKADSEIGAIALLLSFPNEIRKIIEDAGVLSAPAGVQGNSVQVKIVHKDIF